MGGLPPEGYTAAELDLVRTQFAIVTPENCMKWQHVQAAEGTFRFRDADSFMAFAESRHLAVNGHCLVWNRPESTPKWVFADGRQTVGRDRVLARLRTHIETVVGHFRGRIHCWDVVNEALDDGKEFLRPTGWTKSIGPEFVATAFKLAHQTDPQALLAYNDYNIEQPQKREKLLRLLLELRLQGAPVHVVGLQGHWEIDSIPFRDIEDTIIAIRAAGVKVAVTELDLDIVPHSRWWADGGKHRDELARLNPYEHGCPPDVLRREAEQYGQLFALLRKYADSIDRVTFWGLTDRRSWLNDWPWKRANFPLLFDAEARPKPAYFEVLKATPR